MSYNSENVEAVTDILGLQVDPTFLKVRVKTPANVARTGEFMSRTRPHILMELPFKCLY